MVRISSAFSFVQRYHEDKRDTNIIRQANLVQHVKYLLLNPIFMCSSLDDRKIEKISIIMIQIFKIRFVVK